MPPHGPFDWVGFENWPKLSTGLNNMKDKDLLSFCSSFCSLFFSFTILKIDVDIGEKRNG
jgi:hypothetical protein